MTNRSCNPVDLIDLCVRLRLEARASARRWAQEIGRQNRSIKASLASIDAMLAGKRKEL